MVPSAGPASDPGRAVGGQTDPAPADAAHILGARSQQGVVKGGKGGGVGVGGAADRRPGAEAVDHDGLLHRRRQLGVARHHRAGGQDLRLLAAPLGLHLGDQLVDLDRGCLEGAGGPPAFLRPPRLGQGWPVGDGTGAAELQQLPGYDPGSRRHAAHFARAISVRRYGRLQRPEDERGGGGAGVLMADGALPEVRGPALARLHRDGCPHPRLGRLGRRDDGSLHAEAGVGGLVVAADGRRQRVDHGLVPRHRGAQVSNAVEGSLKGIAQPRGVEFRLLSQGFACPAEGGPPEGPAGSADGGHQRPTGLDQQAAGRRAVLGG